MLMEAIRFNEKIQLRRDQGLSDRFWTNKTYAEIGGMSTEELATLELELLFRLRWQIIPQPEVLNEYYLCLVERCEGFKIEDPHFNSIATAAKTNNQSV
ncbi:hypothetical protein N7539_007944 [Penicillium diatomitis]|uniref:Uncharacterized protein n=1 Tax=Penicillium diatomitis TaxID=2819901 RepID=A0A9W9WV52_9EURO|nr:uncharacterized protein N7539_007944 [Penicillium diatomitis]KAJ5475657.1 hypothetical protein N7539_007944 [Penicillium diatomitis]